MDLDDVACSLWHDADGWRGWSKHYSRNVIFFNDIPEPNLVDAMQILSKFDGEAEMEGEEWSFIKF